MIGHEHGEGGSVNVNFEVAEVTRPLGPHGSFVTRGCVAKPTGDSLEVEHSNGASWMRLTRSENGTKVLAPNEVQGTSMPLTKVTHELPSVEDHIYTTRDDAEARIPVAVPAPKTAWR